MITGATMRPDDALRLRTTEELFEVVVREIKERDEDGTFRFFASSRRGAQRLCVAFMKAFPWIETIEIAYMNDLTDQYLRRTPEHPPGTADWWHVDLRILKDPNRNTEERT